MVKNFDEQENRDRNSGEQDETRDEEEEPVAGGLAVGVVDVGLDQVEVAAVGLEDAVEEGAGERERTGHGFDADVDDHAGEGDARDAELDGAEDNVEGEDGVGGVSNAGDEVEKWSEAETEAAGKGEGVVEPAGEGFDIGDARVGDFGTRQAGESDVWGWCGVHHCE